MSYTFMSDAAGEAGNAESPGTPALTSGLYENIITHHGTILLV